MSIQTIGTIIVAVTILVNLALAYGGYVQQVTCTIATAAHSNAAAVMQAF